MDYKRIQADAEKFIVEHGNYVFDNWHNMNIDTLKDGGADVSTNFDKEVEQKFYEYVSTNYPDFGFEGEENAELNKTGEYTWMIDPIDGTKFFAAGIPLWCVTISLVDQNNNGVVGLIYNPVSKQLYSASQRNGAFLNGKQIYLTQETDIKKLQVNIDLSSTSIGEYDFTDECHRIIDVLERNFYRARMLGSGALSLAWLAQGFFGAFVDPVRPTSKMVDIAGGVCIAREAGATVETIEIESGIFNTIVAREGIVNQVRELLNK